MAELPFLQSYGNPDKEEAYQRFQAGGSLRSISRSMKLALSTLGAWSQRDRWEDERKARRISEKDPGAAPPVTQKTGTSGTAVGTPVPTETRAAGMERILARQQRLTGRLIEAYDRDVDKTITDASTLGKPITRSQVAQLAMLGNNLMAMERKAWCVPDKIETTGAGGGPIETHELSDVERSDRIAALLESARARRTGPVAESQGEMGTLPGTTN